MATDFGPSALITPANGVTVGRLAATPLLLVMILRLGTSWLALGAWVLLAGTDGLDGWLARRHGTTRSGAFLDPLADKVLVLGALLALVDKGRFWWVPVGLIAVREVGISVYRSRMARRGVSVPARPSAKAKTVLQDVAVGFALLPTTGSHHPRVATTVLWVAVAFAAVSAAQYLLDGRRFVGSAGA
jgi:CDP-diacylglycerol---glycerol-3-phosphate 3-phosphatidyltransferase